ncbi:uncharacterized protein METZ01_LOCUS113230, partial [marine metagenome]
VRLEKQKIEKKHGMVLMPFYDSLH